MTYDFPTAFSLHGDEERRAAARVLASGRMTMAGEVEAFEAELAAFHGRRHAVMVNSGSSANLVAVEVLVHTGYLARAGGVFGPAVAWATTYAPIIQADLNLVIGDIDDTWNARVPTSFSGSNPHLLVAVPVLGNPAHLAGWRALADRLGVPLLEDACESIGAMGMMGDDAVASGPDYMSRAGTFGTISTLSFFYSHQLSAWEGGAALTDDDDLARTMRLLRNHGNAGWGSDDLEEFYQFEIFGYNLRPSELHAAVGREQLKKLPAMVAQRRANAALFREMTADLPIVHPRVEGSPSPFGLAFTVPSLEDRRRVVVALRASSIDARLPTGGSFTRHPYGAPWREANPTPRADLIHDTGLFLGCAPWPIPDLIERAVRVIKETL